MYRGRWSAFGAERVAEGNEAGYGYSGREFEVGLKMGLICLEKLCRMKVVYFSRMGRGMEIGSFCPKAEF